ncbi:hypothetical protein K0U27_06860 [archaeon]|nr:hypothetical protein [archaeon]
MTPLFQRPWRKLSPRQKMLRERSLVVLSELRNTKNKTLPQAANDNNVTVKNVIKHTNGFKKVNGKPIVKKWDRIRRVMRINTDGKEKSVEVKDSRTASVVGRYHNAVKQFLNTGDKSKLSKFRNKKVKDSKGKVHKFETNPDEIIRINQRIEEPEFYEVYNTK